jgi:hypothetical protein
MDGLIDLGAASPRTCSENDLLGWLGAAAAGDALEYHRGFLALDRDRHGQTLTDRQRAELAACANRAFALAGRGLVHLVQRRLAADRFSYLAIARPRKANTPLAAAAALAAEAA